MPATSAVASLFVSLEARFAKFESAMQNTASKWEKFGRKLDRVGKQLSVSLTVPIVAGAKALITASGRVDDALDKIAVATGTTGKALKSLEQSFKKVAGGKAASSLEDTAVAIGELNTRLGLTGEPLEALAEKLLVVSRLTGTNLNTNVQQSSQLFKQWKISTDQQVSSLDMVFSAAQRSGVGFGDLTEQLTQFGPVLRTAGFSLQDSISLLSQLHSTGVETGPVMAGLTKTLSTLADGGVKDLSGALVAMIADIKNAKTAQEALDLASEAFGKKGALRLTEAIRLGNFEFNAFSAALTGSAGAIETTRAQTDGLKEAFQTLGNQFLVAAGPIEEALLPAIRQLEPVFKAIAEALVFVVEKFALLSPTTRAVVLSMFALVAAVGPLSILFGGIASGAGALIRVLTSLTIAVLGVNAPIYLLIGLLGLLAYMLASDDFSRGLKVIADGFDKMLPAIFKWMDGVALAVLEFHDMWSTYVVDALRGFADDIALTLIEIHDTAKKYLVDKWTSIVDGVKGNVEAIYDTFASLKRRLFDQSPITDIKEQGIKAMQVMGDKMVDVTGKATEKLFNKWDLFAKKHKAKTDEVAEALKGLQKQWVDATRDIEINTIRKAIDDAVKSGNTASLQPLFEKLRKLTADGILDGMSDAAEKGGPQAKAIAQKIADARAEAEIKAEQERVSEALVQSRKEAHQTEVTFWTGLMEDAITGTRFDWEEQGKKAVVAIASEFLAAFTDVGSIIASNLYQQIGGALASAVSSILGIDLGGAVTSVAGSALSGAASGAAGGGLFAGVGTAITSFIGGASGQLLPGAATAGTASAYSAASSGVAFAPYALPVAAVATAAYGAYKLIEHQNKKHPEQEARLEIIGALEEILKKNNASFVNPQGQRVPFSGNLTQGTGDQFRDGSWVEDFKAFGDEAFRTFNGLGLAFQSLYGIAEDVGPQIGFILAQNLGGNIDNARLLVQQLGLNFQDMEAALLQMATSGQITWHEFEVGLQGVTAAFQPGVAAVGDMNGAVQALIDSGGRGQAAIKALRDLAVEATEAGVKDLEGLKTFLLSSGKFTTQQIEQIFSALRGRGVTSLEDLSNTSDRVAGGIVADLESMGFAFAEVETAVGNISESLNDASEDVKTLDERLRNLPEEVHTRIIIEEHTESSGGGGSGGSSNAGAKGAVFGMANGGIISGTRIARIGQNTLKMGEFAQEAMFPLTSQGGKLAIEGRMIGGGSSPINVVYNITAPNATGATVQEMEKMLKRFHDSAVNTSLIKISDAARRGGGLSSSIRG